jgi:hypothetical protein
VSGLRRRLAAFFLDPRVAFAAPLVLAVIAAVPQLLLTAHRPPATGYTHYNNFIIFRQAFVHLVGNVDLYLYFPGVQHDNFLYSPTFAALMAPFAPLPLAPALVLWDLLNAAVLVLGIRAIPGLDVRSKALFVWFILPEFIGASQHSQTNPAIVGLLLLTFWAAEAGKDWLAPLFLALATYVKIFPIAAGLLFLLYPRRVRLVLWTGFWMAALALVPLLFVSPSQLAWQYGNWWRLHTTNPVHVGGIGISAEGILRKWFGIDPPRGPFVAAAALVAMLPLLRVRDHARPEFRAAFLGLMLAWMIAFNHNAESPTFVIAMAGIALWYFSQRSTPLHKALLWLAFLLVSVSYSDLVPSGFRGRWIDAYALKGLPVVLVWMVGVAELVLGRGPGPRARST